MVTEEQIQQTVSDAEKSFQDCWEKLFAIKDAQTLFSFQPILLSALYKIEATHKKICQEERELIGKKLEYSKEQFSKQMQALARYKAVLDLVFDIGKVLGDAFAWIFYNKENQLLKNHYDHEFIPRLALGTGGRGEYVFFKNSPRFGKYFVLAHSITTFLRQGDVSLIDPTDMKVAAIGELKTKKISETEISISVSLIGAKIPKEKLPNVTENSGEASKKPNPLSQQVMDKLKRQIKIIQEGFRPKDLTHPPEKIEMRIMETRLKELFNNSAFGKWSTIKVARGLLLVGIKSEEMPLYLQLKGEALIDEKSFKENLESLKNPLFEICDKNLPNNFVVTSWILYPANGRYFLPFGMRPFLWWPLDQTVLKAIIFQKFRVMTLYNPAFLIHELKQNGFEVQFQNKNMKITKKIGGRLYEFSGMDHFVGAVRNQFLTDASIVDFVKMAAEKIEAQNFKQPTHINIDFEYLHE